MKTLTTLAIAAVLSTATQDPAPSTAWVNGRWFDGKAFTAVDVYSTAGRLTLKRPAAVARTVDLKGRWVTGAFGEAHNHNIPGADTEATIRKYLAQGIFYVMIQANTPDGRESVRGLVNTATSVDVAFANGGFTAPGGHPTALVERNIKNGGMKPEDRDGGFLHPVSSTADVDRAWTRSIRPQRPDFIKLMLVYSEDRLAGVPRPAGSDRHGLDPALAPEIVRRAHADKLRVSAHVESAADFAIAVDAGADVIAHMPGFWPDEKRIARSGYGMYMITEEAAARAGRQRTIVVTTIGESLRLVSTREGVAFRPVLDVYRHNLDVLAKHGVRIAIGSDQFRDTSLQEALDIHAAGLMRPADLLRAFTTDAAAAIFPTRAPFGLAEGAPADFVVFDADPIADFTAVRRVGIRVKAGRELQ